MTPRACALRALTLALALLTAACASSPRRAPPPDAVPGFPQTEPHVSRWKGRATVGEESRRFRLAVLSAPEARFVLELSTSVGATVLRAAHDGQRIRIVIPRERVFLDEEAAVETVERLLGLPLDPDHLVAVLVGRLGPPAFPPRSGGTATQTGASIDERGGDGRPRVGRIAAGEDEVVVRYGAFVGAASGALPGSVDLSWSNAARPVHVRLRLRSARAAASSSSEVFRLEVPERFRRVWLAELEGDGPLLMPRSEDGPQ